MLHLEKFTLKVPNKRSICASTFVYQNTGCRNFGTTGARQIFQELMQDSFTIPHHMYGDVHGPRPCRMRTWFMISFEIPRHSFQRLLHF